MHRGKKGSGRAEDGAKPAYKCSLNWRIYILIFPTTPCSNNPFTLAPLFDMMFMMRDVMGGVMSHKKKWLLHKTIVLKGTVY